MMYNEAIKIISRLDVWLGSSEKVTVVCDGHLPRRTKIRSNQIEGV